MHAPGEKCTAQLMPAVNGNLPVWVFGKRGKSWDLIIKSPHCPSESIDSEAANILEHAMYAASDINYMGCDTVRADYYKIITELKLLYLKDFAKMVMLDTAATALGGK